MKRLDRYVVKEMVTPFITGTVAVVFMFQANELIAILKTFNPDNVPPLAILQLILYKSPAFLNLTLPIGVSLGASLAMSRLVRESELTALRAAGIPIRRVLVPIALFGAAVGVGNYYIVERVTPAAELESRKLISQTTLLSLAPDFQPNVTISLRNGIAYIGSVARQPGNAVALSDLVLFERPKAGETWILSAKSGVYTEGVFRLKEVVAFVVEGSDLRSVETNEEVVINERIIVQDLFLPRMENEQTQDQLREAIEEGKRQNRDTRKLEVTYHTRYSVPASCLFFALTSPIFAIWLARSGGLVGVMLSVFSVGLYYNAFVVSTEIFGRNGWVSPWMSAWLPNILFVVLGLIALRRLE